MKTAFRWLIQFYRLFISPMLGPRCRFFPSCSVYALEALEQHSLGFALWLIVKRLGRCHPWGGSGYDPVPDAPKERSKNGTKMKMFIQTTVSKHLSCSCCLDDHKFLDDQLSQSCQNGHMNHKFTPYTNPPHNHRVFLNGFVGIS